MGKITCANVLSDLYALAVTHCDNLLMLLGIPMAMTAREKEVMIPQIIRGFKDMAMEAGTIVTGGRTTLNPWCMIGGVATAVCCPDEYILPQAAQPGDLLVLTKPLGTGVAVYAHSWLTTGRGWERIQNVITPAQVHRAFDRAIDSMLQLNINGARLMYKHGAHAATDITGFGLLGHAHALARHQRLPLTFVLHTLPVIAAMKMVAAALPQRFPLLEGTCPETSGGLLVVLPPEAALAYIRDLREADGRDAWVVGRVEIEGEWGAGRTAVLRKQLRVLEIPQVERNGHLW